ncbi:tRNA(His) guanylyltransferase 1-like isoform X2 [Alnus glutinosa]|uniref:tRNA(His) guanylyltransferase 1-like isoform X2 n=1 Tax=Alnus glutinosa TaxID=3517 RepID=UPI002D77B864|nr:tRNA(His) guanylyltransferase 1-like isoform X2 [Alnus glutinosa]
MANSKYEYVKSFEVEDEVMLPNLIVVRIDGRNFRRFSEVHEFEKPVDGRALNLMNLCATAILEEYPDIVFSYGFNDEYSFVFKKTSKFYQRRASKLLSLIVSFFSSVYVMKWKEIFPEKELKYPPSFQSRVICCASKEVLQTYLAWRQNDCHVNNLHDTCLWMLIKEGETQREAQEFLKGTQKQQKNELLFQKFGINYKNLPALYRQGSCIFKTEVEENVKYNENGTPVKRLRRKARIVQSENIAGRSFWNELPSLLKEVGGFTEDVDKINPEYVRSFQFENKLMPSTWIVVRIDGCHFHRFSEVHEFEKPNDKQALNLMNSCAVAVLDEIQDIIFAYGVSDEYSFALKKDSQFYQRRASEIVSVIVSFFSSIYVTKWKEFFPRKELKYPPSFDGRVVCYPSSKILQDYLAWRQVDCHINNQYNTCFWMLVNKKGKGKSEAQNYLKGTQAREKNELLLKEFNIDYNELEIMFRQGSLAFWEKEEDITMTHKNAASLETSHSKVIVEHCDIIKPDFWEAHPSILNEKPPTF